MPGDDEHGQGRSCCGTCELAELTAEGKVRFEESPHLVVADDELAVVVVHEGDLVVRRFPLRRGQRFVVGRSPDVDIVLRSALADRRIFALETTDTGAVFAEDLDSKCGTLVNGCRITRRRLDQRDIINVANNTFLTFQQGEECGRPTALQVTLADRNDASESQRLAVVANTADVGR